MRTAPTLDDQTAHLCEAVNAANSELASVLINCLTTADSLRSSLAKLGLDQREIADVVHVVAKQEAAVDALHAFISALDAPRRHMSIPRKSDSREAKLAWLAWNDRNGTYTDEDSARQDMAPMTDAEAWTAIINACSM